MWCSPTRRCEPPSSGPSRSVDVAPRRPPARGAVRLLRLGNTVSIAIRSTDAIVGSLCMEKEHRTWEAFAPFGLTTMLCGIDPVGTGAGTFGVSAPVSELMLDWDTVLSIALVT